MKKLLLTLILGMFLISLASAVKVDYSPNANGIKDMKAHIEDTILFGLISTGEQGTMELKSHQSPKEVLTVGFGNQVTMYYDTNFGKAQQNALGDVTFIDMRTGKEVERDWKFVYWGIEEYESPVYTCLDKTSSNGTITNQCTQIGTETKTREKWLDYNSRDLPKGQIRIGVMVDVKINDYIDGIWEVQGKKIDKHASWTADLKSGLIAYYNFSGNANDYTGQNNGTNNGATFTTGYNQYFGGANFASGDYISLPTFSTSGLTSFSIGFIAKWDSTTGQQMPIACGLGNPTGQAFRFYESGGIGGAGGIKTTSLVTAGSESLTAGQWYYFIINWNGTTLSLYRNGTNVGNSSLGGSMASCSTENYIGTGSYDANDRQYQFLGTLSGVWYRNESLTTDQIDTLVTGDNGDFLPIVGASAPTVTLLSPENNTTSSNQTIEFIGNISDATPINVSLIIDDVYNETNTSGVLGNYTFTKSLLEGTYSWKMESCNLAGCTNSTSRTLIIDTIPFIEFLTPPTLINDSNIVDGIVPIKVNVSTLYYKNISYDLYNTNGTSYQQTFTNTTYAYNFTNIPGGSYNYNVTTCTTTNKCNSTETRYITQDSTNPTINISSPLTDYNYLYVGQSLDLNFTASDSNGIDTCLWNYNGTNYSISCTNATLTNTSFILEDNNYNITVYVNDTFGNLGSNTTIWTYKVLDLNNYTYSSEVIEATNQQFISDFKLGETLSDAYLNYDGTNYSVGITSLGSGAYRFTKTITIPLVAVDENKTFFYYVNGIKTMELNQTVVNSGIDNCSSYSYLLINYTLKDEETQTIINNSNSTIEAEIILYAEQSNDIIDQFNQVFTGAYNVQLCSKLNLSGEKIRLYELSRYYSDGYVAEIHNIQNAYLNETDLPININLLDLTQSSATEFKLTYKSSQFLAVEDALIDVQRYYIGEGVYKSIEIPATDSNGQAKVNFDLANVLYRATVSKDGVILAEFENLAVICDNELQGECYLNLNERQSINLLQNIDTGNDFIYRLVKDNRTISVIFSSPSGTAKTVRLIVNQSSILGNKSTCNQSLFTSSGQIDCTVDETLGDAFLNIEVYINEVLLTTAQTTILENREQYFGTNHIVLTFFLVLSIVLMFISDPIATLIGLLIGIIASSLMLLLNSGSLFGGTSVVLYLIITIILLIVKISKR